MSSSGESAKVVYWHRELPPRDAEPMQEHVIEATSDRVSGTIERDGDLWHGCYAALMENTRLRLEQEVTRLGGQYAHVTAEHIETTRKAKAGLMAGSPTCFIGALDLPAKNNFRTAVYSLSTKPQIEQFVE